jgi:hypothetical protein
MTRGNAKLVGEVIDMSYHRNGVTGRGFWNIIFKGHPNADEIVAGYKFVATFFAQETGEDDLVTPACVAVLRLCDLQADNAEPAWRGDSFHSELQSLVESYVWKFEREEGRKYDGAGREMNDRKAAVEAQKERAS